MGDVLRRMVTFFVASCAVAYLIFLAAGATISARNNTRTVWVRDEITPNTHHLAGNVTVRSSCTELTVKTEQLTPNLYKLKFSTWEHPNVDCTNYPVQKEFYTVIFAPAVGISFIGSIDDKSLPIMVVPYTPE